MPDDKKGIIGTIKERWAKFKAAGKPKEERPRRVDLSRAMPAGKRPSSGGRTYRIRIKSRRNTADERRSRRRAR